MYKHPSLENDFTCLQAKCLRHQSSLWISNRFYIHSLKCSLKFSDNRKLLVCFLDRDSVILVICYYCDLQNPFSNTLQELQSEVWLVSH
jgi:hypothetical protein